MAGRALGLAVSSPGSLVVMGLSSPPALPLPRPCEPRAATHGRAGSPGGAMPRPSARPAAPPGPRGPASRREPVQAALRYAGGRPRTSSTDVECPLLLLWVVRLPPFSHPALMNGL